MNSKKILLFSIIFALGLGLLGPALARDNENGNGEDKNRARISQDRMLSRIIRGNFSDTVTLNNAASTTASGTARFSVVKRGSLYSVSVRIRVNDEKLPADKILEAWLMDNATGYKLSLGGFTVNALGRGDLQFSENLVNFPLYDKVMVTEEPINDSSPNPAKTILEANIPASFNTISFRAALRGANEAPANNSPARGTANFVLNVKEHTLRFNIVFSGLSGAETGAHIHGPALAGQNAPVLFALPAGSPKIGVWNYDPGLEADILAGRTYVNVHSSVFPGGEIRGQLRP